MTRAEVEAMVRKENEKAFTSTIFQLRSHKKPYPAGYIVPQFHKLYGRKGNTREHMVCISLTLWESTTMTKACA